MQNDIDVGGEQNEVLFLGGLCVLLIAVSGLLVRIAYSLVVAPVRCQNVACPSGRLRICCFENSAKTSQWANINDCNLAQRRVALDGFNHYCTVPINTGERLCTQPLLPHLCSPLLDLS